MSDYRNGTMDLRTRLIIRIGIVLGIIIAVVLLTSLIRNVDFSDNEEPAPQTDNGTAQNQVAPPVRNTAPVGLSDEVAPELATDVYVQQQARLFVERYATNSNQNDNRHLTDVDELITAGMRNWIQSQTIDASAQYEGVTTNVVSQNVAELTEDTAIVTIGMQQTRTINGDTTITYQNARVELELINDQWLIDGYFVQ